MQGCEASWCYLEELRLTSRSLMLARFCDTGMNRKVILLSLIFLSVCARGQNRQQAESDALNDVSESLKRVIRNVAPAIVSLDVIAFVRPDDSDSGSTASSDKLRLTKSRS